MLLKGVLIPRLLSNSFAAWFLIIFYFLLSHIAHFDNIVLPLLVAETFGSILSVFFCTLNNKITLFYFFLYINIYFFYPLDLSSS